MKKIALGSLLVSMIACGNQSTSELDRIPGHEYKGCPLIDLNNAELSHNDYAGVWEGIGSKSSIGPVGINLVIAPVGYNGAYTYMMHTFPISSNPNVEENCQSGMATTSSSYSFYADSSHATKLSGKDIKYSVKLNISEEGTLEGLWRGFSDSIISLRSKNAVLSDYIQAK